VDDPCTPSSAADSTQPAAAEEAWQRLDLPALVTRSTGGGVLMGLANLVPGISGGTMLLATGIYPRFIDAVADLTRCRLRLESILVLACVAAAAGAGILLLAGTLRDLVVHHRWVMYSLFIGLTLGGLPVVWHLARPASKGMILAAVVSFSVMVVLAVLQAAGVTGGNGSNRVMLFLAGVAAAGAMILPGVSGGYLLLLMGQYVPILSGIDTLKSALRDGDLAAMWDPLLTVVLPVGLGVALGVAIVGNLLQWLLHHYQKPTMGGLIGLLLGSTVGLWPFQRPLPPKLGDTIKGQRVTAANIGEIDPEDWCMTYFQPDAWTLLCSIGLILLGLAVTTVIAHVGHEKPAPEGRP
jgi:putative membrane protein